MCVEHTKWGRYSTVVNSSPRHFLTTAKLYHLHECSGGKITNQVVAHKISRVKENFGVKKCLTENLTLSYILTKVFFEKQSTKFVKYEARTCQIDSIVQLKLYTA